MNEIIERIKEKIKNCNEKSREGRIRKGAYVDCIVMIKESGNLGETRNAVLADVLAEFESEAYLDNNINDWVIDFNTVKLLLSKYFR